MNLVFQSLTRVLRTKMYMSKFGCQQEGTYQKEKKETHCAMCIFLGENIHLTQ